MNEQMQNAQYNQYGQYVQPVQEKKGLSLASMILGIVGFLAWCLPLVGFPVCITGLILGIVGIKKGRKRNGNCRNYYVCNYIVINSW